MRHARCYVHGTETLHCTRPQFTRLKNISWDFVPVAYNPCFPIEDPTPLRSFGASGRPPFNEDTIFERQLLDSPPFQPLYSLGLKMTSSKDIKNQGKFLQETKRMSAKKERKKSNINNPMELQS